MRTSGILSKHGEQTRGTCCKTVEARTRSPLRIRASNKVIDFSIGDQLYRNQESFSIDDSCRGLCKCRWPHPRHL